MYMPDIIFGFVGLVIILVMVGYLALIQKNFRDQQKVALTMFFLRDEGAYHFKVLAISMVIYSASMFAVGLEMIYTNWFLEIFTRAAILVSMAGLLYFVRGVEIITGRDKN